VATRSFNHHPGYWAFLVHRLSGVALAAFLPVHFLVLALALKSSRPEASLAFAALPVVKLAELLLVVLLTVHLAFGLRVLAFDFARERAGDRLRLRWITAGVLAAVVVAGVFLVGVPL